MWKIVAQKKKKKIKRLENRLKEKILNFKDNYFRLHKNRSFIVYYNF